jgi:hypothetical protein
MSHTPQWKGTDGTAAAEGAFGVVLLTADELLPLAPLVV